MSFRLKILLVDDDEDDCRMLQGMLETLFPAYALDWVSTYDAGLEAMCRGEHEVYLVDYILGARSGLELLTEAISRGCTAPVILITGYGDRRLDIKAIELGAADYLPKDHVDAAMLERSIRHCIKHKQAERALRESEERYRAIVEDQSELICRFLPDGSLTFVNDAYCRFFGESREALIGRNILAFVPAPDCEEMKKHLASLDSRFPTRTIEHKVLTPGGQVRWQQWTTRIILDSHGRPVEFQAVGRDTTERKLMEEALKTAKELFEKTFAAQLDAIFILDNAFPPKITACNPAASLIFGYSTEEVVGRPITFLHLDEAHFLELRKELLKRIDEAGHRYVPEFKMKRSNGEVFYSEHSMAPLHDEEGNLTGWVSVVRDITDRKTKELALLSSAQQTKLFAYSVSHDLKSPAVGLHGLTKMLVRNYSESLDEKGKEYCEQILKSSRQIALLVDRINDFITTKEFPLNVEPLRLLDLCEAVRKEFAKQLKNRKLMWTVPAADVEIHADELSLLRVLRNFVDNALKYAGDGLGEIGIEHEETDEFHIISVRNDGAGIRAEDCERVFTPFLRRNTSKKIPGAGLGLTIVKEIAEKHGGGVWVKPGPRSGTVFHFSISKRLRRVADPRTGARELRPQVLSTPA